MEEQKELFEMLDLMIRPGFCVRDQKIVKINQAARGMFLAPGADIGPLLASGAEEYAAFQGGCLYLSLNLGDKTLGATVVRVQGLDIFLPDQENDPLLQALDLASRELRQPLTTLVVLTENLLPDALPAEDPEVKAWLGKISQALYRSHRIQAIMSDAGHGAIFSMQEIRNITAVFADIFEKVGALVAQVGVQLHYEGPAEEEILGLIDDMQMERAVLNIVSNALKFMPAQGGRIDASLTCRGDSLQLCIQDNGSGIAEDILGSVFSRYTRPNVPETLDHGLGLGLVLVRAAAAQHGGTELIDRPGQTGPRGTLTMKLRRDVSHVRSFHYDLSGGRDLGLIELAEQLPSTAYEQ